MSMRLPRIVSLSFLLFLVPLAISPALAASCIVHSGSERANLIELYTSEGCSSCPPADRWLSGFVARPANTAPVVALAFHVDYWDYIGWKDRFASPAFTSRQQERVANQRGRYAYTPQVILNGRDTHAWRPQAPGQLLASVAQVPGADLSMRIETGKDGGRIAVELEVKMRDAITSPVVYFALYENGLSSEVHAGENSGRRLRHDFVVREWVGPLSVGNAKITHVFNRPEIVGQNAGIAAILETADGSRLLQAVSRPLCIQ